MKSYSILFAAAGLLIILPSNRANDGDYLGEDATFDESDHWYEYKKFTEEDLAALDSLDQRLQAPIVPVAHPRKKRNLAPEFVNRFYAREQWPNCRSIAHIWNQGRCWTCWAATVASVLTDRFCIASGQTTNFYISAEQIAGCADKQNAKKVSDRDNSIMPGKPARAFEMAETIGVVTGGVYKSKLGCQPYSIGKKAEPIKCRQDTCTNDQPSFMKMAADRERKAIHSFVTWRDDRVTVAQRQARVLQMKEEIVTNGPILSVITVFSDFRPWRRKVQGPYQKAATAAVLRDPHGKEAGHVLRIVGWDIFEPNGRNIPYWIATDTKGLHDPNNDNEGYLHIEMGQNMVNIEGAVEFPMVNGLYSGPLPKDNRCKTDSFLGTNVLDQIISVDPTDDTAPFYLFLYGCVQMVFWKDDQFVATSPAVPTHWVFDSPTAGDDIAYNHAGPQKEHQIVRYKFTDSGQGPRLYLYNHLGRGVGCSRIADSKFRCGNDIAKGFPGVPEPDAVGPRAQFYDGRGQAKEIKSWTYTSRPGGAPVVGQPLINTMLIGPDGKDVSVGQLLVDRFAAVTALARPDLSRLVVTGKNLAGKAATVVLAFPDPKAAVPSFTLLKTDKVFVRGPDPYAWQAPLQGVKA